MSSASTVRKPIGVRATPEQLSLLKKAAAREHRSVSSFVLDAALTAAKAEDVPRRRTPEEIKALLEAAREEVRANVPPGQDILEEFLADRRRDAARE